MIEHKDLERELTALLNRYSAENDSNTPDYILAEYLLHCLSAFNIANGKREQWHGRKHPMVCGALEARAREAEGVETEPSPQPGNDACSACGASVPSGYSHPLEHCVRILSERLDRIDRTVDGFPPDGTAPGGDAEESEGADGSDVQIVDSEGHRFTWRQMMEELQSICANEPLWPGDTISHTTARACEERGWAKRDGNGNIIATPEGRRVVRGGAAPSGAPGEPGRRKDASVEGVESVSDVASELMLWFNESPRQCPICGIGDGEHEDDELCSRLEAALMADAANECALRNKRDEVDRLKRANETLRAERDDLKQACEWWKEAAQETQAERDQYQDAWNRLYHVILARMVNAENNANKADEAGRAVVAECRRSDGDTLRRLKVLMETEPGVEFPAPTRDTDSAQD